MTKFTKSRNLYNGDLIEVTAVERDGSDRLSPGFSITGTIWEKRGNITGVQRMRQGRDWDTGGSIHEEILSAFPELAPIVKVHLANLDGVPMHAKENGWHFYSGQASAYERRNPRHYPESAKSDLERSAQALHIDPAELLGGMTREEFGAFVDSLTDRYAADAFAARALMEKM